MSRHRLDRGVEHALTATIEGMALIGTGATYATACGRAGAALGVAHSGIGVAVLRARYAGSTECTRCYAVAT